MTGLTLVAAGGLAREALAVVRLLTPDRQVRVLDDDPATWGTLLDGVSVDGPLDLVGESADDDLLVCAGRGATRRALVSRLTALGVADHRYARVIHPSIEVPATCTVAPGSILLAQVALTTHVTLRRHVVVMPHVTLTHDDVVEDFATLCAGVSLGGNVRIGEAAYLGMNCSVREGLLVGPDAVLGMGACLVSDLPGAQCWVGVPAGPSNTYLMEIL